jgi:ABC-type branched-subunit amino acid transport system ATPase component
MDLNCAFLIVENKTIDVLRYSDRVYFMRLGEIIYDGMSKELLENRTLLGELYG